MSLNETDPAEPQENIGRYERFLYKRIPLWFLILFSLLGLIASVFFGSVIRHVSTGGERYGRWGEIALNVALFPAMVKQAILQTQERTPLLIENHFPNIDGFKVDGIVPDAVRRDKGYLLLSAYDPELLQSTVKLIRVSDQKVLHRWVPDIKSLAVRHISPEGVHPINDIVVSRYRIGNPLLMRDGGIVFHNFEGPLYKLDVCSGVQWINDGHFHHAINADAGDFWVSSIVERSPYESSIFKKYRDDSIARVNASGQVVYSKSVTQIFDENGYKGLIFGAGPYEEDAIHLNEVVPAKYSTPYWEKGDLLLSLRNRSTVALYRPATGKLLWVKTGPWLNQHSPSFVGESRIAVFGNDVARVNGAMLNVRDYSDAYLYDFKDKSISKPYSALFQKLKIKTPGEGRLSLLDGGDAIVDDSWSGRFMRLSATDLSWVYMVKVSDKLVGMQHWSRYLNESEMRDILPVISKAECKRG